MLDLPIDAIDFSHLMVSLRGIYFLVLNEEVQYIGSTINLVVRIKEHMRTAVIPFKKVYFIPIANGPLKGIESQYILEYLPPYNGIGASHLRGDFKDPVTGCLDKDKRHAKKLELRELGKKQAEQLKLLRRVL